MGFALPRPLTSRASSAGEALLELARSSRVPRHLQSTSIGSCRSKPRHTRLSTEADPADQEPPGASVRRTARAFETRAAVPTFFEARAFRNQATHAIVLGSRALLTAPFFPPFSLLRASNAERGLPESGPQSCPDGYTRGLQSEMRTTDDNHHFTDSAHPRLAGSLERSPGLRRTSSEGLVLHGT